MMTSPIIVGIVRGLCVAVFLFAIGQSITEWQWWAGAISLNIALEV
jgi:hypothetical protein